MKLTTACACVFFIVYRTVLTRGETNAQEVYPNSTQASNSDAPTLTEILAGVMITIAIVCMIIVLLLLWCLRRRRRRSRDSGSTGTSNNGFVHSSTNERRQPTLEAIPEHQEPPGTFQNFENSAPRHSYLPPMENFQNTAPRPSYLPPMEHFQNSAPRASYLLPIPQLPSSQSSSQYGSENSDPLFQNSAARASYRSSGMLSQSQASSHYGSENSEAISDMTIADTTLFIQNAVNTYLRLLKDQYQFKEGEVPILPVVPQETRPVSSGSTTPPVPLPKQSKRKSLCRKNTVNMNTYINGWDASKWELSRDQLSIDDTPLASGYFGDVFKAKLDVWTGKEKSVTVVIKTLRNQSSNREKAQFLKELATHALIEPHVNIVRLIGCCTKSAPLLMVLEYVENGSLSEYLFNKEIDVDQGRKNLVCFGHQIADGMAYLSEMKIVHRDLAARNVLLTADQVCKVSDFGFAKDIFGAKTFNKRMSLEPVRWMAPESIKENVFSTKSDIWAFGVVLWEIITFARIKPYSGVDSHVLRQQMISGEHTILKKPKDCPSDVFRIMKWCWSMNPDDRPSFHLLSDILDDMREEYLEASETAFGTITDVNRPSVSYNEDELNVIASARRISTDL